MEQRKEKVGDLIYQKKLGNALVKNYVEYPPSCMICKKNTYPLRFMMVMVSLWS